MTEITGYTDRTLERTVRMMFMSLVYPKDEIEEENQGREERGDGEHEEDKGGEDDGERVSPHPDDTYSVDDVEEDNMYREGNGARVGGMGGQGQQEEEEEEVGEYREEEDMGVEEYDEIGGQY